MVFTANFQEFGVKLEDCDINILHGFVVTVMHKNSSPVKGACKLGRKGWNFMFPARTVLVLPVQGDEQFGDCFPSGRGRESAHLLLVTSTETVSKASC